MIMDVKQIQEILPHRYPFLLVDRVLEMEEGKRIVASKAVTMNEYFFQGHFPQEPVMPGVLIMEALAQTGAIAVLSMEQNKGKIAYFGGMNKVKFRNKVVPGDVLTLEMEIINLKSRAGVGKGTAYVDVKKVSEGELTFMIG